jgi:hypothetical protein
VGGDMEWATVLVMPKVEKPERRAKRRDRGSGCVNQPTFKGADGLPALGWWRIKFSYEDPATGQRRTHDEKASVDTKTAAVEFLIRRKSEVLSGVFKPQAKPETITYEQLRDGLLDYYETEGLRSLHVGKAKNGERRRYVWNLKQLDEFFGAYRAVKINTETVEKFRRDRKRDGASVVLINRGLSLLRRMFHLAVEKGSCARNIFPYSKCSTSRSERALRTVPISNGYATLCPNTCGRPLLCSTPQV